MEQEPGGAGGEGWSTYRTIGAGWPDFYALLQVPSTAPPEEVRAAINAAYSHASANIDHRDLRKRFYYQTLQEKLLPECRRILLDPDVRGRFDEQWHLHGLGLPGAIPYSQFLLSLPGSRAPGPPADLAAPSATAANSTASAAATPDIVVAEALTAHLEAQLAAQLLADSGEPDSLEEFPVAPVPSADEARRPPENIVDDPSEVQHAADPVDAAALSVNVQPSSAISDATLPGASLPHRVLRAARVLRVRGEGRLLEVTPPWSAPGEEEEAARDEDALKSGAPLRMRARISPLRRPTRVVINTDDTALRSVGRRSHARAARKYLGKLVLGGAAIALASAGATWAISRGAMSGGGQDADEAPVAGVAPGLGAANLEGSVENAVSRVFARTEATRAAATRAAQEASGRATTDSAQKIGVSGGASSVAPSVASASGANLAGVPSLRLDTLLRNADFEGVVGRGDGDIRPWQVWAGANKSGLGTAFGACSKKTLDARSGRWRLLFWKEKPFEASAFQVVRNLKPGLYQLNAWTKRSGGQEWAGIVIAEHGQKRLHVIVPASTRWTSVTVRNIRVSTGRAKIGFYTRTKQGKKWFAVDAVEFHRQT